MARITASVVADLPCRDAPIRSRPRPAAAAVLALAMVTLAPPPLLAHPHTFLDTVLTLSPTATGITGFWIQWTFDPFFSATIIGDNDRDANGVFNASERGAVEANAFSNLRHFGYFTHVTRQGKDWQPDRVEGFEPAVVGDRLVYRFFVRYPLTIAPGATERIAIAIYDGTFFSDVRYAGEGAVRIEAVPGLEATWTISKGTGKVIRYDAAAGNAATNLGTSDPSRYTGTYRVDEIVVTLRRPPS